MKAPIFHLNQKVQISTDGKKYYKSLVQKMDNDTFSIQVPASYRGALLLQPQQSVVARFSAEDAQYYFPTRIISRYKEGELPLYVLANPRPESIVRSQLRDFARYKMMLSVRFTSAPGPDFLPAVGEQPEVIAYTIDVSGGGLQILVEEPLKLGTWLWLWLEIPGEETTVVSAVGKVVRRWFKSVEGLKRHTAGIRFEQIAEKDQDLIMGYIFRRMLEDYRMLISDEED
jgi:c-di-GMP-binding flagellar brake protein YcgR